MSTRLHIVVSDGLLKALDDARGDVPRSAFIRRAIDEKLTGMLERQVMVPSPSVAEEAFAEDHGPVVSPGVRGPAPSKTTAKETQALKNFAEIVQPASRFVKTPNQDALERQRKLNEGKS